MAKFLSALIFAAALLFALGTGSSMTYAASDEDTAQAEGATQSDQGSDEEGSDESSDEGGGSEED
jgi:hypothetical protein